jgi:DNA-binding NtrC family response regulator
VKKLAELANTVSSTIKTLFLDDSHERHEAAKKYFGEYWGDVTWCWTAQEAIQALQTKPHNVVFLDHDLGGEQFVDSRNPNTGMEVVRWIIANKPVIDTIVVHSWNIPASKVMCSALQEAGYSASHTPFSAGIYLLK